MGGLSKGGPRIEEGVLTFSGTLSLENNGGFSFIRTQNKSFDLSGAEGIKLKVKGDGRTYQLRFECEGARFQGRAVSFSREFVAPEGEWTEIQIPFSDLQQSFRGRSLEGYTFEPSKIEMMGLLIGDKVSGDFRIEVDRISTYGEEK